MPDLCHPVCFDAVFADSSRAGAGEVPWGQHFQAISDMLEAWGVYMHGVRLADGAVTFAYEVGGFPQRLRWNTSEPCIGSTRA